MLEKLEAFKGQFWTDLDELIEEVEDKGFNVVDSSDEHITVHTSEEDFEDTEWIVYLVKAGATYVVDYIEEQ